MKAELHYEVIPTTEPLEPLRFIDSLFAYDKAGIFSDCVLFTYEKDPYTDVYYLLRYDTVAGTTCIVLLKAKEGKTVEELEKVLRETIFSMEPEEVNIA